MGYSQSGQGSSLVRLLDFDTIARRNCICILSIFQTISSYLSAQTGLTVRAVDFVWWAQLSQLPEMQVTLAYCIFQCHPGKQGDASNTVYHISLREPSEEEVRNSFLISPIADSQEAAAPQVYLDVTCLEGTCYYILSDIQFVFKACIWKPQCVYLYTKVMWMMVVIHIYQFYEKWNNCWKNWGMIIWTGTPLKEAVSKVIAPTNLLLHFDFTTPLAMSFFVENGCKHYADKNSGA